MAASLSHAQQQIPCSELLPHAVSGHHFFTCAGSPSPTPCGGSTADVSLGAQLLGADPYMTEHLHGWRSPFLGAPWLLVQVPYSTSHSACSSPTRSLPWRPLLPAMAPKKNPPAELPVPCSMARARVSSWRSPCPWLPALAPLRPTAQQLCAPPPAMDAARDPPGAPVFPSRAAPYSTSMAAQLPWTPRNSSSEPPSSLFVVVLAGYSTKCAASRAMQQPIRDAVKTLGEKPPLFLMFIFRCV
jgi:hypothetical protein